MSIEGITNTPTTRLNSKDNDTVTVKIPKKVAVAASLLTAAAIGVLPINKNGILASDTFEKEPAPVVEQQQKSNKHNSFKISEETYNKIERFTAAALAGAFLLLVCANAKRNKNSDSEEENKNMDIDTEV